MNRLFRTKISIILLLALTLVVSACGNGNGKTNSGNGASEPSQAPSPTAESQPSESPSPAPEAKDEGTLTVYLNDFDGIVGPLFEAATGYKVELVVGNGAEIMSRVEAEKGNPHWDVIWMDAMPSIYGLGESGQLMEGWAPSNLANLNDFAKSFVPEKNWYVPTGAHAAGVIVYNKDKVKAEDAPRTWADFLSDRYKDATGMADPAVTAPAYPYVSWFFNEQGMEEGQAFFSRLMDNGLKVYPKNPNVVSALTSGEISVAALQESNAYAMKNKNEPIEIIWPERRSCVRSRGGYPEEFEKSECRQSIHRVPA